jgi:hypothetical protein
VDPYEPEVMRHVRYALLEGWHVYRCKCQECGHDWPKAVEPGSQIGIFQCPRCKLATGHRYWFLQIWECS